MTTTEEEVEAHQCHFCGTFVKNGLEYDVDAFDEQGNRKRHWLSDCRPDLVEHEIGPLCTWPAYEGEYAYLNEQDNRPGCYAYTNGDGEITTDHIHFYPDGPM